MSETVKSFIGRVAVVEQEGSAVRVLLNEGETMYAARDLLAACGCAYPTKWCQREAKSESDVKLVKLPFPINGKTGGASRRSVPMYFVTERCGRMILDIFGCSKETRAWISPANWASLTNSRHRLFLHLRRPFQRSRRLPLKLEATPSTGGSTRFCWSCLSSKST